MNDTNEQINCLNEINSNIDLIRSENELDADPASDQELVYANHDINVKSYNETIRLCCGNNFKITKSQLCILLLLCPYFFLTSSYYSLFSPFFPVEALKKNITQTQVGLIFGIYQFAFLILAPLFGKYVIKINNLYCV